MTATPQQLRQWSEEVAADPGSPSFLPLAEHYRDAGRRDAALRLVVRGLERHPHDVEAHHLLGLLYLEAGDETKAFDEWDIALALAPEHHGARRQIAFLTARRGDLEAAERHAERVLESDFADAEIRALLEDIHARRSAPRGRPAAAAAPIEASRPPVVQETAPDTAPPSSDGKAAAAVSTDAEDNAFDLLQRELHAASAERGMIGAVLLDAQGYVVAGEMQAGGRDRGSEIGAVLSPAHSEAQRAVRHLKLGSWKGILVETPDAVIRLSPTADGGMTVVAGRRDVPTGWVLRVAGRVRDAAGRFLSATGAGR